MIGRNQNAAEEALHQILIMTRKRYESTTHYQNQLIDNSRSSFLSALVIFVLSVRWLDGYCSYRLCPMIIL